MSDIEAMAKTALDHLNSGDVEAFLDLFLDEAKFFVPGATRISGDHDKAGYRGAAAVQAEISGGTERYDLLEVAVAGPTVTTVSHAHVERDGSSFEYHVVHSFTLDGEGFRWFWVYLHEYDQFDLAWR